MTRFGFSERRRRLLEGLRRVLTALYDAGCRRVYVDGSFVTSKPEPADFDGCWEERGVMPSRLDRVLLDFDNFREKQKRKYGGEMFPAGFIANEEGAIFVEFFQVHRETGGPKGIVAIDLDGWEP